MSIYVCRAAANSEFSNPNLLLLQAPCRAELQRALDRLASNTRTHDDLFTIPIPNCDKNGDFHPKQVCDFQHTLTLGLKHCADHYRACLLVNCESPLLRQHK